MRSFKISVIKFLSVMLTMLMLGTSITFAQVSLTFPTVSGAAGSTAEVKAPITVGDLTGQNVTSYQFVLSYDPTIIDITGVDDAGTLSAGAQLQQNPDLTNGILRVAWAKNTALTGSGTLLYLKIKFKAAGVAPLNPGAGNFMFNAGTPAVAITAGAATSGAVLLYADNVSVTGLSTPIKIPIKASAITTAQNVLAYQFDATFNPAILEITGTGFDLAGTKSAGGQASINFNNTAGTVRFAWAGASPIVAAAADVVVYLTAKAKVKPSTSLVLLTSALLNTGAPTVALNDIDKGVVTVLNATPVFGPTVPPAPFTKLENQLLEFTVNASDADGDALVYTYTSAPALVGTNSIVGNKFSWTPSYTAGTKNYVVTFTASDGTASATLAVTITVMDDNRAPSVALDPAGPFTVNEGQTLTFKVVGTDLDTDNTVKLTNSALPSGATFAAASGNFSWKPTYAQAGTYKVTFTVTDNAASPKTATVDANITVTNINTAPRYDVAGGRQLPDTLIMAGKNLIYPYKAIDAEGDVVTYFMQDPKPENAVVVPSTGVLQWRPANTQAKIWQIVVVASDGVLSTVSRIAYVTVKPDVGIDETNLPTSYSLYQNYPNPFNPSTSIKFALPKDSKVRLSVYNILGQEMAVLVNGLMPAGYHSVKFDATNLTSGMYIYKIQAENFSEIKKMLLMK